MLREFREFAMRGSLVDMAVGIIIGAAFGKIVTSLVNDIVMPPIGLLLGNVDFAHLYVNLSGTPYATLAEAQEAGAATINYGQFINVVLDFLIVALAVFLVIRLINRLKREEEEPEPEQETRDCPECLSSMPLKATRCPACTSKVEAA